MAVEGEVLVRAAFGQTKALDLSTTTDDLAFETRIRLIDGTGLNMANKVWHDTRTIAASGNDDIDLSGVLLDPFGVAVVFTRVKGLILASLAANANNINVGGLGANGFLTWVGATGDLVVLRPGGVFCLVAPDATAYAVTPATADLLRVTNAAGGTSVTYSIAISGTI